MHPAGVICCSSLEYSSRYTMIFTAPEGPLEIPDVALTPFLLERAGPNGDKPAFIDAPTGRILTHAGWARAVRATAAGLAKRGFRQGEVFAIYSPNNPEYAIAFHAVSLLGGIVTTINPAYTVEELAKQLASSKARYLLTTNEFLDKASAAARQHPLDEVFVLGSSFDTLRASEGDVPPVAIDPASDVVVLPYSSGTTGMPKGVMLTHSNLLANVLQCACAFDVRPTDTLLAVLPFFHIYGMNVIMNLGLYAGATTVTMPRFDLKECLEAIQKYRITYGFVVPPIMLALARNPLVEQYDLRSLRTLFSGAAPLSPHIAAEAAARLHCSVKQGYGMTEASPATHGTRPGSSDGIGLTLQNTESKIADVATGAELGPGTEGEICVRGPQVMKGYLNNPVATAAMIDTEGWLHTGDIGFAREDGCFFVVDRVKELIKYKGMQIAPAELEALLLAHPAVADAAVVPLEDEEAGQIPKAFVVLKEQTTTEDILKYIEDRVARYKRIRHVEIIDAIPRSASGKILRRVLVERDRIA
jgi:acyl-CoA synthetase (AMP-forming)/AMP-acid ligase II